MRRISSQFTNNDIQHHMRMKEYEVSRAQKRLSSQNRVAELRDDPIAMAQSVRMNSIVRRAHQYERNSEAIQGDYRIAESFMAGTQDVVHRIRELVVQGANGIYGKEELQAMGREVNELLKEILANANGRGSRGQHIFSGDKVHNESFHAFEGRVPEMGEQMITQVEYRGSINVSEVEIAQGETIEQNFLGNKVFWAENQSVFGAFDSRNFRAQEDGEFFINGQKVSVTTGDTVHSIIAKIHDSKAPVRASLDPVTGALSMKTTDNHQLWVDEAEGQGFLTQLGITSQAAGSGPNNFHPDARVFGGSIFDVVMQVRDAFFSGDKENLGGRSLLSLDTAMDRLNQSRSELGAKDRRVQFNIDRLNYEIPEFTARASKLTDIDMADGIMELNMLENVHKAILGTAGRILRGSLLDYLR